MNVMKWSLGELQDIFGRGCCTALGTVQP